MSDKQPTAEPVKSNLPKPDAQTVANSKKLKEGDTAETKGSPTTTVLEPGIPDTLSNADTKKKNVKKNTPLDYIGSISIRPYIDGTMENMGLENYGFVLFPGTVQEEQLAAIERNGITRYITGLNEFAPEVQNLNDEEKKLAIIQNIRFIVSDLEKKLAANVIDVKDDEFWNKVTLLKPDNDEFWAKISLKCSNEPTFLNPKEDPYDLIKFMAIEAGGFDIVAKSYEDAQTRARPPKFYLDKEVDTVSTRTQQRKLKNKAIALLDSLSTSNPRKLFYVTKCIDTYSARYKNATPSDILYESMDEFINGEGVERSEKKAAELFIKTCDLDMETLKIKAVVKDASFYNFIQLKGDGMLYHTATGSMLGRNVTDVVEALKNPLNDEVLGRLLTEVEEYWNQ